MGKGRQAHRPVPRAHQVVPAAVVIHAGADDDAEDVRIVLKPNGELPRGYEDPGLMIQNIMEKTQDGCMMLTELEDATSWPLVSRKLELGSFEDVKLTTDGLGFLVADSSFGSVRRIPLPYTSYENT